MPDKHPYISSGGALLQLLDQLRKSFPAVLSAEVLKKLSIAPGNESYALNIVRFLGLIDEKGNRTPEAQKVFILHDDAAFEAAFADQVRNAYKDLFALHQDEAWTLSPERLIPFFRQSDQSTSLVGTRQTSTFRTLSTYSGKLEQKAAVPAKSSKATARGAAPKKQNRPKESGATIVKPEIVPENDVKSGERKPEKFGLTVRIEVNLPASGDQETYDRIFRSIKKNLLNG